ncbi:MAG: GatB/YqeY domain-containing protein [Bacteroidetes bacterium]|nr:GatB/YqeY domain-containing protein [Bacteroidota bacterium]MBL0050375.1 GatB/YqeY domain-containing protein [Bacteroidota bacterium]
MDLAEKINNDIKTAMLSKDAVSLRALRAIKAAILISNTSGGASMSEADEVKMLQKLVKQRQDSIDIYKQQNREDLAVSEIEEVAVIQKYLPQMMSEAEVRSALVIIKEQTGASSPADMGKMMGVASKQLAGKADNKMISQIIKELLAS